MSCLCYNMYVIIMRDTYNFYIKTIKPLEKKYTRLCILYSFFKFKFIKNKIIFYNKVLIKYYGLFQNDNNRLKELENMLTK